MNPERRLLWSCYPTETSCEEGGTESKSRERNQRLEEPGQMASLHCRKTSRGRFALRRPGQTEFRWMKPGPSVAHPKNTEHLPAVPLRCNLAACAGLRWVGTRNASASFCCII